MVWRSGGGNRLARSLCTWNDQLEARWPHRNTAADGTIGDAAHQARQSDHNPNSRHVVQGDDTTHDPARGPDCHVLFERLRHQPDLRRVKYAIFDGKIFDGPGGDHPAGQVRTYHPPPGGSMHREHLHLSVADDPKLYDDPRPWAALEEDDVPLTAADLEAIRKVVREVLTEDELVLVPGEADAPKGAKRTFATAVRVVWALGERLQPKK